MKYSLKHLFLLTSFFAAICATAAHNYHSSDWDMSWDVVQYWYFYDRLYLERGIVSFIEAVATVVPATATIWLLARCWKRSQEAFWGATLVLSCLVLIVALIRAM